MTVFSGKNSNNVEIVSCVKCALIFGIMVNSEILRSDNCVSGSKVRKLSTSSSNNSIRYGNSLPNENTSMMPPRMENSPGSYTKSVLLKPYSISKSSIKSTLIFSPVFKNKVFSISFSFRTSNSCNASGKVTIKSPPFLAFKSAFKV